MLKLDGPYCIARAAFNSPCKGTENDASEGTHAFQTKLLIFIYFMRQFVISMHVKESHVI